MPVLFLLGGAKMRFLAAGAVNWVHVASWLQGAGDRQIPKAKNCFRMTIAMVLHAKEAQLIKAKGSLTVG